MLLGILAMAGCGPAPATPPSAAPPAAAATAATRPSPTPTPAGRAILTSAPAAPGARAEVTFDWAPSGVRPADADDVQVINIKVMAHRGILGSTGNETRMLVVYDPTLISVDEIQEIFRQIGHPVVVSR